MIRLTKERQVDALSPDTEAAVKIRCLREAYGTACAFVHFWAGDGGSAIALMDGCATAHLAPAEREEALLFLAMQPEVRALRTDADSAGRFAALYGGQVQTGTVMTAADMAPLPASAPAVEPLSPRELYPLLAACFDRLPPFDAWYVDVSHRVRHGLCRIVGVRNAAGKPAASAMTTAECPGAALIGAVATAPADRGKGFASACVTSLAQTLLAEGRRVLLSPKNAYAEQLYARLGFIPHGRWGAVER